MLKRTQRKGKKNNALHNTLQAFKYLLPARLFQFLETSAVETRTILDF